MDEDDDIDDADRGNFPVVVNPTFPPSYFPVSLIGAELAELALRAGTIEVWRTDRSGMMWLRRMDWRDFV